MTEEHVSVARPQGLEDAAVDQTEASWGASGLIHNIVRDFSMTSRSACSNRAVCRSDVLPDRSPSRRGRSRRMRRRDLVLGAWTGLNGLLGLIGTPSSH